MKMFFDGQNKWRQNKTEKQELRQKRLPPTPLTTILWRMKICEEVHLHTEERSLNLSVLIVWWMRTMPASIETVHNQDGDSFKNLQSWSPSPTVQVIGCGGDGGFEGQD